MAVFKITYRVSWSDIDGAQVVHHANYFRLFERAEEDFYQYLGLSLSYFMKNGFWLPRVEAFCQYKAPSKLGDVLEISLSIMELKKRAITYGFKAKRKDDNVLVAEGYIVAVAVDKDFGKAINLPKEITEKLQAFKNS